MPKKVYILIEDKFLVGPFPSEERATVWGEANSPNLWKKLISYGPAEYLLSEDGQE